MMHFWNNPIYPLLSAVFKHLDRAWDMFWIKSLGGTFKVLLQKKYLNSYPPLVNVLCFLTQVTFAEIFRSTLYMLTYSRFFRVYDNQQVRPEVSKMAENSKRSICDPKTTRLLKFFKYRNIESTEIILNGFPRKDRGYLIEGNKY